jgi:GNAT superfamily N-acetyltransferase
MRHADSIRFQHDCAAVDWSELRALFVLGALGGREGDKIRRAFERSSEVCFGYDGARLIAAARALSDYEYHATVYDVVVHPDHQGCGVGRELLRRLMARMPVWRTLLIADREVSGFYERSGFRDYGDAMALIDPARLRDPPVRDGSAVP